MNPHTPEACWRIAGGSVRSAVPPGRRRNAIAPRRGAGRPAPRRGALIGSTFVSGGVALRAQPPANCRNASGVHPGVNGVNDWIEHMNAGGVLANSRWFGAKRRTTGPAAKCDCTRRGAGHPAPRRGALIGSTFVSGGVALRAQPPANCRNASSVKPAFTLR